MKSEIRNQKSEVREQTGDAGAPTSDLRPAGIDALLAETMRIEELLLINRERELSRLIANSAVAEPVAVKELVPAAVARVAQARVRWLEPIQEAMDQLIAAALNRTLSDADLVRFISRAAHNMPDLFAKMDAKALGDAMEDVLGAGAVAGLQTKVKG